MIIEEQVIKSIEEFIASDKMLVVLTGAGISAESGIPTYRGVEGYWTKGSRHYKPEEIGTYRFFLKEPYEVWKFACYRKTLCNEAQPNAGHEALAELESLFGARFGLITQNVDGLHIRAGNSEARTCQVHGHIEQVRCSEECTRQLYPFPATIAPKQRDEELSEEEWQQLKCPNCGALLRPHVLWFDEVYEEKYYRSDTALRWAKRAGTLMTVGTSGMTYIPNAIADVAQFKNALMLDVNISQNPFSDFAQERGQAFQGKSGNILPQFVQICKDVLGR